MFIHICVDEENWDDNALCGKKDAETQTNVTPLILRNHLMLNHSTTFFTYLRRLIRHKVWAYVDADRLDRVYNGVNENSKQ